MAQSEDQGNDGVPFRRRDRNGEMPGNVISQALGKFGHRIENPTIN